MIKEAEAERDDLISPSPVTYQTVPQLPVIMRPLMGCRDEVDGDFGGIASDVTMLTLW